MRRVFLFGSQGGNDDALIAKLSVSAQAVLGREVLVVDHEAELPVGQIAIVSCHQEPIDFHRIQNLAANGNVVFCRVDSRNLGDMLLAVAPADTSILNPRPSLLSLIRMLVTYARLPAPGPHSIEHSYSRYLSFDRSIQETLVQSPRSHWRSIAQANASLEAFTSSGHLIFSKGNSTGSGHIDQSVFHDSHINE